MCASAASSTDCKRGRFVITSFNPPLGKRSLFLDGTGGLLNAP
jgi:hypothetical protein